MLGQSQWIGRIYGDLGMSLFSRRPVIYHGAFGRGLFQTLYEPPSSMLSYLPFTLEWAIASLFLCLCAIVSGRYIVPAFIPLAISLAAAVGLASSRKLDERYDDWMSRGLLAVAGAVFSAQVLFEFSFVLLFVTLSLLLYKAYRLGQILHHVLEIVAQQMNLVAAGKRV